MIKQQNNNEVGYMTKGVLLSAVFALSTVFFACGSGGSSSDDGDEFQIPELHPENYTAVDAASSGFKLSNEMMGCVQKAYSIAVENAMKSVESKVIENIRDEMLDTQKIDRSSSQTKAYNLTYSGEGVSLLGTVTYTGTAINEYPMSYVRDVVVRYTDYMLTANSVTYKCTGTVKYKAKGTYAASNSYVTTDYISADFIATDGINSVPIKFEYVKVEDVPNGSGTYTEKEVFTIDGSQYGASETGPMTAK